MGRKGDLGRPDDDHVNFDSGDGPKSERSNSRRRAKREFSLASLGLKKKDEKAVAWQLQFLG